MTDIRTPIQQCRFAMHQKRLCDKLSIYADRKRENLKRGTVKNSTSDLLCSDRD